MSEFFDQLGVPTIYAYTTPNYFKKKWEGSNKGSGLLKVGYTRKDVEKRIWEQFPTKTPEVKPFTIIISETALDVAGKFFTDHAVHRILKKKGFRQVNGEWFECSATDVLNAIEELKQGKKLSKGRHQKFPMRPEQKLAVELTQKYFNQYKDAKDGRASHYLWNANAFW